MNFWKKGRYEQRKFYSVKLGQKQNFLSTVISLLLTLAIFLPLILGMYQFIFIYGYSRTIFFIFIALVWFGVMCFNAVMNYFAVRFAKVLEKNNAPLQGIDEKYVFYYQLLNPAFAFASLAFILFIAFELGGF